jgi:hypothetical protein
MTDQEAKQAVIDEEHLRLLWIGYVISGAMTVLVSFMGLMYAAFGFIASSAASSAVDKAENVQAASIAWFFGIFGILMFLALVTLALAKFSAAICIRKRRSRALCMVVAGISCLGVPYGTFLGVCTFLVLCRKSVAAKFETSRQSEIASQQP